MLSLRKLPARALHFLMKAFGDVRDEEALGIFLLMVNVFLLLAGYYIIKTVREPLILATGGAEMKSYAAGVQAAVLVGFVPLYSWFASRVGRLKLIVGLTLLFVVGFELFSLGALAEVPYIGFAFYVFVGIFSLSIVAQFWSYANDLFTRKSGERLFGVVAIGATVGAPVGAALARLLYGLDIHGAHMMHITSGILLLSLVLYWIIERQGVGDQGDEDDSEGEEALDPINGFKLVFQNRYLMLIAALMILLNLVNTTGEYILGDFVVRAAEAAVASDGGVTKNSFIGSFYGEFYFGVNIAAVLVQSFVAARLAKYTGIAGMLLVLPIVAMGAYGLIAAGVGFTVVRWAKTAENSTDYSLMNTAKAMLWLPTTREEKYSAKQAIDTFMVRGGDMLSAGLVFAGTTWIGLGSRGFAGVNLGLIVLWFGLVFWIIGEYKRRAEENPDRMEDLEEVLP